MARTVNDTAFTTKAAREKLPERHQPYWRSIETGAAIGYRKGKSAGAWLVRVTDATAGGGYRQAVLGRADDKLKADGAEVLTYDQALGQARDWIARHNRVAAGMEPEAAPAPAKPYTVADALADYVADFTARGGKGGRVAGYGIDAHILPTLGKEAVGRLTRDRINRWLRALAATPARLRPAKGGEVRHREADDDPDATRRRRASANRILTILKAALNHARAEGKATCTDDAWSAVKPFREVDAPKVRYLSDAETTRLINACASDFRDLVIAALLTGCRYGELAAMKVGDFDATAGTITIPVSKAGKVRHVIVTDEGRDFFARLSLGRATSTPMLQREFLEQRATRDAQAVTSRSHWRKSDQSRPIREACRAAKIAPAINFHILRHCYASRLAMRGVPMPVIAAQLGHSDTRMTERHYAHLAPSHIANVVREAFGTLGIEPPAHGSVVRLRQGA